MASQGEHLNAGACSPKSSQDKWGSPENSENQVGPLKGLLKFWRSKNTGIQEINLMFYSSSGGEMHFAQVFWEN